MQYRIKILFRVLMFGKPECDVFQPEPHSGEACNTLSHKSLTNVNIQKGMLYVPPINHKGITAMTFQHRGIVDFALV